MKLGLGLCYLKAITQGRYICIEGWYPVSHELQNEISKKGLMPPAGWWNLGLRSYFRMNLLRNLYVYNVNTANLRLPDAEKMLQILKTNPDLQNLFMPEKIKNRELFIKYVELINKSI